MRRNLQLKFGKCCRAAGILCLILLFQGETLSQDIHFTNFRLAPLSVNPALTGSFVGTYRISGIYRDQWRAIDNSRPYATPFISAEYNIAAGLLTDNDWVAGGISFVRDQSGSLNMTHQMTAMNVGYHLGMDKDYSQVLSIGVTYGSMTRRLDLMGITPQALENAGAGPASPIAIFPGGGGGQGETQESTSFTTISAGLAYKATLDGGGIIRVGANLGHLNNPDASLLQRGIDSTMVRRTKLDAFGTKLVVHGEGSFLMNEKMRMNPAVLFQSHTGFQELAIQSTLDYLLNPEKQMEVTGGLGYRFGDAIEIIGGIKIKDLKIQLSYDVTTSSLTRAGGGAFELGVGYVGSIFKTPQVKPVIFCPRL